MNASFVTSRNCSAGHSQVQRIFPLDFTALIWLHFRLFEQDKEEDVIISHLKTALELDSENEEAREMLIRIHQRSRKVSQRDRFIMCSHSITLTLPGPSAGVSRSLDSYCSLKPLCSGMGEVVPAHTSPTLLPPSPRTVLSLSCFKVLHCINCRD